MNESPEKSSNLDQYHLLEKQKKELFEDLIASTELSKDDRDSLLARVFEHSVEDGVDLAEKWVSDKSVVIESVITDGFIHKHPDFSLRLSNRLQEYRDHVDSENKEVMSEFAGTMLEKVSDLKQEPTKKKSKKSGTGITQSFLERVDEYYLNFIRLKKVKEQGPSKKSETKGESIAEQTMIADLRILEPHYYPDAIRKLVGNKVGVGHGLLDQQTVEKILKKAKLSPDEEEVEKVLKKARYKVLDIIYNVQHDEPKKLLKQELITQLQARGYNDDDFELVKNEKRGKYEVVDKTGQNHEFKAENLRLTHQIPFINPHTPDILGYSEVKNNKYRVNRLDKETGEPFFRKEYFGMINGEPCFIANLDCGELLDQILIYPDGSFSKKRTHAIQGFNQVGNDIMYTSNDSAEFNLNRNFFVLHKNDERINDIVDWNCRTPSQKDEDFIVEKDGSIYWIGLTFDYNSNVHRPAILKNNQILMTGRWGEDIDNLIKIDDKITYLIKQNPYKSYSRSTLVHGEEKFGPHKDIKISENKEKLIFVATREDGTSFIYENGAEKELEIEGDIESIVETEKGTYILTNENVSSDSKKPNLVGKIFDTNGVKIIEKSSAKLMEFGSFGGKLTYVISSGNKWRLFWGDESIVFSNGDYPQIVGILGDDLVYKQEFGFGTFKKGEIKNIELFEDGDVIELQDLQVSEGRIIAVYSLEDKEDSRQDMYKVYEYAPEFTLTSQEKKKLELLNILESNSAKQIREYFEKEYPDESKKSLKEKIKDALEHSKNFAQNISQMISESPALFLDTLSAKTDDLSDRNIDEFISIIFPEVQTNHRKAIRKARNERPYSDSSVSSYLSGNKESYEFSDGDPNAQAQLEILTLRQPVREFISSGIYGSLRKGSSSWQKVPFQISESHVGPTREVTAEIKVEKGMKKIMLPKCLNAYIIPERVKGVQEDDTEITLDIFKNSLGEVSLEIPDGIVTILYSQSIQELPVVPPKIDTKQYENFRKDIEKRFGNETVDSITRLPDELKIFIESIEDLEPIEKVEAVESFVKSISYYDFDNADMQSLKKYKSTEEIIAVMSQRMKELKRLPKTPDKEKLGYKKYAGVCTDFAKLTTALLRESGIVSGMISGFQTDGTNMVITEKNAHAVSYALFPAENGKVRIIEIDGTPHGLNDIDEKALSRIRQLSLKERIKKFEEGKEKAQEDQSEKMRELEDLVSKLDDESIKKLQNGELEQFLNTILSSVKESHVAVIDSILNASRYAGYNVGKIIDNEDLSGQVEFVKFIETEIKKEKSREKKEDYFKGEKLFKIIEEFMMRYSRDEDVSSKKDALKIIEKVLDLTKKYLDPLEYRSAIAIVTYLKAKKMS